MTEPIIPPEGYDSWLDYAIATMETRDLLLAAADSQYDGQWPHGTSREDMRAAAQAELAALRRRPEPAPTFKIIRFYQRDDVPNEVVARGLTLVQAQDHCNDRDTCSSRSVD